MEAFGTTLVSTLYQSDSIPKSLVVNQKILEKKAGLVAHAKQLDTSTALL